MTYRIKVLIFIFWIYSEKSKAIKLCSAFSPSLRAIAHLSKKDVSHSTFNNKPLLDKPMIDGDDGWGLDTNNRATEDSKMNPLPSSSKSSMSNKEGNNDRDIFIPAFTALSLLALFGTYGYETLRLYSRGEFYSPWH